MRLCGEMRIAAARSKGKRVIAWPLRAHVMRAEGRLMREAYRLNCQPLKQLEEQGEALHIAIYNMDKELPDYAQIERAMSKLIAKIIASTHVAAKFG